MATVCVFTPTFNRAYILPKLYESLIAQTSQDFSWMVVDDGSTDNTAELIQSYIEAAEIDITYIKTENGGKQRAINVGVEACEDELFFVVDSDDYLVPNAVEYFVDAWEQERDRLNVCGIVALRGTDVHTPMGTWMPDGVDYSGYWDLFEKYKYRGDTSLIHRTSILKEYPYHVAEGEKFVAETAVYYRLDGKYVHRTRNAILTICHYLPDGYTKNLKQNIVNNPIGFYTHKQYCSARAKTFKWQVRETLLYEMGCFVAGKKSVVAEAPHPVMAAFLYFPALVVKAVLFRGLQG